MAKEIRYRSGSQSKYDAYLSYDENIMFYCTDTGKLYKGDVDFTEAVRMVEDHSAILTPARNVLYMEFTGAGWVFYKNAEGSDVWHQVINPNGGATEITIVTAIDETSTDDVVPSAKAVYTLFQSIEKVDLTGYAKTDEVTKTLESYALKTDIKNIVDHKEYEVSSKPVGTIVDYREKEIRVMIPEGTQFVKQNSGEGSDANAYYIGFKAYAPADQNVVSFKESLDTVMSDDTMYYFEDNEFAGVDGYGRKYSIVWLPAAKYDEASDAWTYYGANSTEDHYIGWYYRVDWYDADGVVVGSDMIRINLSNEECHYAINDAVMSGFVTEEAFEAVNDRIDGIEETLINVSTWGDM